MMSASETPMKSARTAHEEELRTELARILPHVRTPAQYIGREIGAVRKDPSEVEVSFCLAFPDTYSVGMSHVGLRILYEVINREEGLAAERLFAPWPDMGRMLRERKLPLCSLESTRPAGDFDVLGFSLQYELTYTNVLYMLELAGIPLLAAERARLEKRGQRTPLVIGGGPCAYNPEPVAEFFDAFVIGDGEEAVLEIAAFLKEARRARADRGSILRGLAGIEGLYVPSLYEAVHGPDGILDELAPIAPEAPARVQRRVVRDLDSAPFPTAPVVPYVETVHDRYTIEIMRGCVHRCRFCQAGVNYRPRRERSVDKILQLARDGVRNTGYDEVGLASLSTGDYSRFRELLGRMVDEFEPKGVSLSVPSLRVDKLLREVPRAVSAVRRSGLTFAPECATERLRRVVNKPIENSDLMEAAKSAFEAGWEAVKLYFMIGLPGERDEDVRGIAAMAGDICFMRRRMGKREAKVNLSVASFVPRPHTPFQWEAMVVPEELRRRQGLVRSGLGSRRIRARFHDVESSVLEAALARGDRRLSRAVLEAYRRGCVFDAWGEWFRPEAWREAFGTCRLDPSFYAHRERGEDELLPWAHIEGGAQGEALLRERKKAYSCMDG